MQEKTYISKFKRPRLIVRSRMSAKFEGKNQLGKAIQFEDFQYKTSDKEEQDFIENHKNFGADYWLLREGEEKPKDNSPKVGVSSNPDRKEIVDGQIAELKGQIESIGGSVEKLAGIVMQLAETKAPKSDEKKKDEGKSKKDDKKASKGKK